MKVQPAKRFPYREITGFGVNKYTDLVKFGNAYACGTQAKEPSVLTPHSFLPCSEKRVLAPGLHQDFCRTPPGSAKYAGNCSKAPISCFIPHHEQQQTFLQNCKTGFHFSHHLCFSSCVLLVPSNPQRGSARPRRSVPALVGLQSEERGKGV